MSGITRTSGRGRVLVALLLAAVTACAQPEVTTRYFRSETYTFSRAERATIDRIANATAAEVHKLLPGLPTRLEFTARPGTDVIKELGATALAPRTRSVRP